MDTIIWGRVFELTDEHGWNLEEALHGITNIRGDIEQLMQPRPKMIVQSSHPRGQLALEDIPRRDVDKAIKNNLKDKGKGKSKGKGSKDKGKVTNGSNFCKKINSGQCTNENCAYAHRCTYQLDSGRICGEPHAAINCGKKRRKQ